jgi:hypothetical protein
MADAEAPGRHPQCRSGFCGAPNKVDFWRSARRTVNDDVGKGYPGAEARAQGLEHGLFGREPPCQTLGPIVPISNLIEFGFDETTGDQRVARIFDPAPQLGDLDEINAMSDDIHSMANK